MSLENFITNMLNIKSQDIDILDSVSHENGDLDLFVKLKPQKDVLCPYCKGKARILGYVKRKLTHSALANRKCSLFYMQRRYYCRECERSFCENNPFTNKGENITVETKINILKDFKHAEVTYSAAAARYNVSVTWFAGCSTNAFRSKENRCPKYCRLTNTISLTAATIRCMPVS